LPKKKRKRKSKPRKSRAYSRRRLRVVVALLSLVTVALFGAIGLLVYHTLRFEALVDSKLAGEAHQKLASVHARPFEVRAGQRLAMDALVSILNDLGYRRRDTLGDDNGSFARFEDRIELRPAGDLRVPVAIAIEDGVVRSVTELRGDSSLDRLELGSVPVTTLFGDDRAKRRWVPLEEIPPHVSRAVLATEDRRFFEHTGLDPIGIVRALVSDVASGELRQGGSTLTQQLVKNYFLTPERTFRRKILEAYLAILLETRSSKEEILELYLNDVYLGQRGSFGINGVEQGAQIYFGKNASNLTLSEAAVLAAIIRAPNASSPFRHAEQTRKRRDIVIGQMLAAGFIDESAAREAREDALEIAVGSVDEGEAPYFVDALRRDLLERFDPGHLQTRGLTIRSTMDRYLQNQARRAIIEGLEEIRAQLPAEAELPQAALVAMSPLNGDVLALVGARSYGASQFNRATDARRQPGSAFKPFVYLAAFEADPKRSPATMVEDAPTTFRQAGREWTPQNYSRRFEGRVSYRRALALSLNVATARVGRDVGFDNVVTQWESMGMPSRLSPYPSLVLGAFELTPLELAAAFAILANGGRHVEPRFYVELQDANGRAIDQRPVRSRNVASAESTFLVTDMMRSVLSFGTAREIRARGFAAEAAGKTGTTNDTRDAWFVGYTPELLAVVWVGYDDNQPLGLSGSQAALPIWTRFMKDAVSGRDKQRFTPPSGVRILEIDPSTGMLAGEGCSSRQREVFRASTAPKQLCTKH